MQIIKNLTLSIFGLQLLSSTGFGDAVAPVLKISGYTDINFAALSQHDASSGKGPGYHLMNCASDLYFTITGKTAWGLDYSGLVDLEMVAGDKRVVIAQNYIELKYGVTMQIGGVAGPERAGLQDASRIIGGAGGFTNSLNNYYNFSAGVLQGFRPIGDTRYATKIVLWSPEVAGFRLAIGFTPNTTHNGDDGLNSTPAVGTKSPGNGGLYPNKDHAPFGRNNLVVGLGFHKELGDLDVKCSLTGVFDKSYLPNVNNANYYLTSVHDTAAYHVGVVLGYQKIQFGGGFVSNGRSRVPNNSTTTVGGLSLGDSWQGNAGKSWNLGAGYDFGNSRVAVAYQQTFRKTDALSSARANIGSATYNITPWQGMSFYAEVDYINTTTNAASVALTQSFNDKFSKEHAKAINNNQGMIGLVGVKLSF